MVKELENEQKQEDITTVEEIDKRENWKNTSLKFMSKLQTGWEINEFTYEEYKKWIDIGLKPEEYNFAWWLKNKAQEQSPVDPQFYKNTDKLDEARQDYDDYYWDDYYQKWEEHGITIKETEQWKETGLKSDEYKFATYLKERGHKPTYDDIKGVIKEENWKDIYEEFEYRWRIEWESRGFNKKECEEWLSSGLQPINVGLVRELRDIEGETPKSIKERKDKDGYLKKQHHRYEMRLIQTFPLEKLCSYHTALYFFLLDYRGKKIIEIVKTLPFDGFYTILQYSNRAVSLAGGSLLLSNNIDTQTGGIITTASAGIEVFLSLLKDRMFGLDNRTKLFDKISNDIEDIYNIFKEWRLMLEHTHFSPFSKEINEIFDLLKLRLDKLLAMKNKYLELVDKYRGSNLVLILRPRRTKKMIWKDAKLYGGVIKELTELRKWLAIFQELVSDYLQGVSKDEIEKKYKDKSEKLKAINSWISILSEGIKEISLTQTIRTFLRSSSGSSDWTLSHVLKGNDEKTKKKIKREIFLDSDEKEKQIDKLANVVKDQINWDSRKVKKEIESIKLSLRNLGYIIKENETLENFPREQKKNNDNKLTHSLAIEETLDIRRRKSYPSIDIESHIEMPPK